MNACFASSTACLSRQRSSFSAILRLQKLSYSSSSLTFTSFTALTRPESKRRIRRSFSTKLPVAAKQTTTTTNNNNNNNINKNDMGANASNNNNNNTCSPLGGGNLMLFACSKCRGEGVLISQSRRQRQEKKRQEKREMYPNSYHRNRDGDDSDDDKEKERGDGVENKKKKQKEKGMGEKRATCADCQGTGLVDVNDDDASDESALKYSSAQSQGHVSIIGGGIGGMALGVALQHRGIRFTIFEKDEEFKARRQGYGLTMQRYSGASALKQLGLELNGVGSDANVALHSNGKVLGEYGHSVEKRKERTANDASAANSNSKHLPSVAHSLRNVHIPRQELRKMLLDAVNPENIRWGMKFDSAKTILEDGENNDDPRVEVTFTNGEKILSDCVVGADGLFSRVRAHKFDNLDAIHEGLNYLDCLVVLGICHGMDHELCKNKAFQILDGHNRLFCMPFSTNEIAEDILGYKNDVDPTYMNIPHAMMWQLSFPCEYDEAVELSKDRKKLLEESRKRCESWCEPAHTLLKSTRSENMSGYPAFDMLIEDEIVFRNGRKKDTSDKEASNVDVFTTLLGDAAHPMSPFKGQGANQALVDALNLARALSRAPKFLLPGERTNGTPPKVANTKEALVIAEDAMLKRSRGKVEGSRVAAKYLHSEAALAEGDFVRANVAVSAAAGEVYDGRNG